MDNAQDLTDSVLRAPMVTVVNEAVRYVCVILGFFVPVRTLSKTPLHVRLCMVGTTTQAAFQIGSWSRQEDNSRLTLGSLVELGYRTWFEIRQDMMGRIDGLFNRRTQRTVEMVVELHIPKE